MRVGYEDIRCSLSAALLPPVEGLARDAQHHSLIANRNNG